MILSHYVMYLPGQENTVLQPSQVIFSLAAAWLEYKAQNGLKVDLH